MLAIVIQRWDAEFRPVGAAKEPIVLHVQTVLFMTLCVSVTADWGALLPRGAKGDFVASVMAGIAVSPGGSATLGTILALSVDRGLRQ